MIEFTQKFFYAKHQSFLVALHEDVPNVKGTLNWFSND